jgi:hypothetical protein
MAGINPYSLNPNQMSNQMVNGMTSPQNVMPVSSNPQIAQLTSSYSTLQNQQAIQNQQPTNSVVGQPMTPANDNGTTGIIANQMRSRAAPITPAAQQKSAMQLQPQKGLQPGQASANAAPKMTVY